METLLQKAKKLGGKTKENHSEEEIQLVVAWLGGEVTTRQVALAKGKTTGNILYFIAIALREAYKKGIIQIK